MTDAELSLEMYVVVGNALHLRLRAVPPGMELPVEVDQETLERLDRELTPVAPADMLAAVRRLTVEDRQALANCCLVAVGYAGEESATVLGAPVSLVQEVAAAMLQI